MGINFRDKMNSEYFKRIKQAMEYREKLDEKNSRVILLNQEIVTCQQLIEETTCSKKTLIADVEKKK